MGKILIPGSGGGADLDVITADAGDVLAPKVTVDKDGEPMAGTLALSGNAQAGDVRPGRTFYGTDPKARQAGTMAERGAAAYTPGTYNQVIQGNQYLTGAQTIWGDGNLASQYIKKGVTIFGVMGSFEGWVPTPQDLYYNGIIQSGYDLALGPKMWRAENTRLYCRNSYDSWEVISILKSLMNIDINIQSYSKLIVYGYFAKIRYPWGYFEISTDIGILESPVVSDVQTMVTIDISQASFIRNEAPNTHFNGGFLRPNGYVSSEGNYITRIRLE